MEMSTAWHGQWMITAGSHYIDQCSSPGHLPCAIVSLTSKSSSGSPYLLHSTIHPQPTSLKPQYNPLHVSADCSPCPEDVHVLCLCACYPERALFSHFYQSLTSFSRPDSNHISYLRLIPLYPLNSSLKGISETALDASVLLSWKAALQRAKCTSSLSLNPLRYSTKMPSTSTVRHGKMSSNLNMN